MKIKFKNLGAIQQAELTLGNLSIICGGNNTGKTYATYALFGFLTFWRNAFKLDIAEVDILHLLNNGAIELDIPFYASTAQAILDKASHEFTLELPRVFASPEKHFASSQFSVVLEDDDIQPLASFERILGAAKTRLLAIDKKEDSTKLKISLLVEKDKIDVPQSLIRRIIGDAIKDIVFGDLFPKPFIASAERTGAAIFRKELNFARNRLLEEIHSPDKDIDPFELLAKTYNDYALPVRSNVDFTRQLEATAKKESFIIKNHPDLLNEFATIIGGDYTVTNNEELYYVPKNTKRLKLSMEESSSAVRSLLDIGFYLRHAAAPGDLLMIDEPELNLHPENQRKMARLFARLINIGVNVFITTHSDYIIKELNTLIMLNQGGERLKQLAERENYPESEWINPDKVKVYIAEKASIQLEGSRRKTQCQTLVLADIDRQSGIEARSFDRTIEEMNRIQEEIVWGGDI